MRFVARVKTLEEISNLHQAGFDVFMLDSEFATKQIQSFNLTQIEAATNMYPKQIYLLMNRMIHQADIIPLTNYLKAIALLDIAGIVIADLTIYVLAKEIGLEPRIIYQPGTMNTDTFSATYFAKKNIKGITISREITLEEINAFSSNQIELSLIGHGYLDMFYSKRMLLTNYLIHKQMKGIDLKNNLQVRLNEEIRPNDFYPIVEDDFGTHIFRSKKLISYAYLNDLEVLLKDFFIERLFIEDAEYYDTIRLYRKQLSLETFLNTYHSFDEGFYHIRTEKIKGEQRED